MSNENEIDIVGEIQVNESVRIIISICRWKSELGIDIRKHLSTQRYTGLTKQGIRIHKKGLNKIIGILNGIEFSGDLANDYVFGTVAKDCDRDIVLKTSKYNGHNKLDLRERINSKDGQFYTKKGLSIPAERLTDIKLLLVEAQWLFENKYYDQ